jgi:hypothetical protein
LPISSIPAASRAAMSFIEEAIVFGKSNAADRQDVRNVEHRRRADVQHIDLAIKF